MAGSLTKFPLAVDSFEQKLDALASDIPYLKRIQALQLKENKTPTEVDELTGLLIQYKNKMFLAQDYNQLTEAMTEMQRWLKTQTETWLLNAQNEFAAFIDGKKTEINTEQNNVVSQINTSKTDAINSVNSTATTAQSSIQSTKDSALIAIEQKKENILNYMDSATAGQIRNDIGLLTELTTTEKASLVKSINEINGKRLFHVGTTPPTDTNLLWIDTR